MTVDESHEDLEYFRQQEQKVVLHQLSSRRELLCQLRMHNDMLKSAVASPLTSQFPALNQPLFNQTSSTPSGKGRSKGSSGRKGSKASALAQGNNIANFNQTDHRMPSNTNGTYQQMLARGELDVSLGSLGAGMHGMAGSMNQNHPTNIQGGRCLRACCLFKLTCYQQRGSKDGSR